MKTSEAKSLLLSLQSEMQTPNIQSVESYQERIEELFVCTLLTGKVVPQSSFRGLLSYIFSTDVRYFNQKKSVINAFETAIKTIWADKSERILFKDHFFHDLRATFKLMKQKVERTEYQQEFDQLNSIQQDKARKKQEELFAKSLFHAVPALSPLFDFCQIRASLFKDIFSQTEEAFINTKELFLQFLHERPDFAGHKDMKDRSQIINKALAADSELTNSMTKLFKVLPQHARYNAIKDKADKLAVEVRNLEIGQKWMCVSSFGVKINSIEKFMRQLRKLPDQALSKLPTPLAKALQSDIVLPDPKQFVEDSIQPHIKKLFDSIPGMDLKCEGAVETFMNIFLYDENKKLPESISKHVPDMVRGELEAILQNGLFGCLIDCTEGPQRQLLEWICLNTETLKDVNKRQDVIDGLGKNVSKYFVDLVGDPKGKMDRTIETMVHQVQNLIPRDMLTLTGLDAHLNSGQLWLELERQADGNFTVQVYGTGQALSFYKSNDKGKFTWPKRIEGVASSKLNADFFERFLFHRIEPNYDSEVISKAEHFFEGILSYLEPDTVPINQKKTSTFSHVDATINTASEMAKQLLINPKYPLKRVQLEFRLQAFMDYCRPLFSPTYELKIPHEEVATIIQQALSQLEGELREQTPELDKEYQEKIQATLNEIKEGLFAYHASKEKKEVKDENVAEFLEPLKKIAYSLGLTKEYVLAVKETLLWALGPKSSPLLEVIANILPARGSMELTNDTEIPGQWRQRSKLVNFIASSYFQAAFAAIRAILSVLSIYRKSFSLFGMISGITYVLDNHVPAEHLTWYRAVMSRTRHAIFQGVLKLILYCFVSKKNLDAFHNYLGTYLDPLEVMGRRLNEKDPLSFDVNTSATFPSPSQPLELNSSSITLKETKTVESKEKLIHLISLQEPPITSDILIDKLTEWKTTLEKADKDIEADIKLDFIFSRLLALETPSLNKQTLWDQVEDPLACMEALSNFYNLVRNIAPKGDYGNKKLNVIRQIAHYKLLAILHFLTRRCLKNDMPMNPPDIHHFLKWIKNERRINDIDLTIQLKEILAYLRPDLDLIALPDENELDALRQDSLFYYPSPWGYINLAKNQLYKLGNETVKKGSILKRELWTSWRTISDLGLSKWRNINWSLSPEKWSISEFKSIFQLKSSDFNRYIEQCTLHFALLPIHGHDIKLFNIITNEDFNLIHQCGQDVIKHGTFKPNTVEEPFYHLAMINVLVLLHNLQWELESNKINPRRGAKLTPAPPLYISSEYIENWLLDKNNQLEHYPALWLRFYYLYDRYLNLHGMKIPDPENIISTKCREVYKKLNLNKLEIKYKNVFVQKQMVDPKVLFSPEFQFLQEKLKDHNIKEALKAKKLDQLPDYKKLKVLFLESFYLDGMLPKAWAILRRYILESNYDDFSSPAPGQASDLTYVAHYVPAITDKAKNSAKQTLKSVNFPLPVYNKIPSLMNLSGGCTVKDFAYFLLKEKRMSQSEIMNTFEIDFQKVENDSNAYNNSNENLKLDNNFKKEICLILSEPSDRINRILGYLSHHKYRMRISQGITRIPQLTHFILSLFEHCLFELDQLEKQSQLSPGLFRTIGLFLKEACSDALSHEKDPYLCLWLVRTSHILQGFCRQLNPEALAYFPPLLKYIDQLKIFQSVHKNFPSLLYHHAASILPGDPTNLSDEEQKMGVIWLCGMIFKQLNVDDYPKQKNIILDLTHNSYIHFGQWKETILKWLEDEAFRGKLIVEILTAHGLPLSPEKYQHWIRTSPWEYQCHDMTVHILKGMDETSPLKKIKKSLEVQYALRGQEKNLLQIEEGHWETPDGCFGIKNRASYNETQHNFTASTVISFVNDQMDKLCRASTYHDGYLTVIKDAIKSAKKVKFFPAFFDCPPILIVNTSDKKLNILLADHPTDKNKFSITCINELTDKNNDGSFYHYIYFSHIVKVDPNKTRFSTYDLSGLRFPDSISFQVLNSMSVSPQKIGLEIIENNRGIGYLILTNVACRYPELSAMEDNNFFIARKYLQASKSLFYYLPPTAEQIKQSYIYEKIDSTPIYSEFLQEPITKKKTEITIYQKIEGKTFHYAPGSSVKPFFKEIDERSPPEGVTRYWVEETAPDAPFKLIYAEWKIGTTTGTTTLKLKKNDNEDRYQLYSWVVDGQDYIKVNLSEAKHHLHSVSRFCDVKNMSAWRNATSNQLAMFTFEPYKLHFKVKAARQTVSASTPDRDGPATSLAYCHGAFEGHHIAENQFHPSLRGIPSYLLLEPKKVLIPDGQWISSLAWRQLKNLGPFAHLANDYLRFLDNSFISKITDTLGVENDSSKYYAYDMDADGNLTSQEPEAVAYLTMLYLMLGKREAAFKASEQLEKLARRMHFPHKIAQLLAPLALVPFEFEDLRTIRMRLFAALEENRLVHKTIKPEEQTWVSQGVSLLMGLSALIDLDHIIKNPDPMRKLKPEQEWFLYRSVFGMLRIFAETSLGALKGKSSLSECALSLIQKGGVESLIEAVGLSAHLSARYREIKKKLQLKNDLLSDIAQGVKTIRATESSLPENFSINRLVKDQSTKLAQTSSSKYTANNQTANSSVYQQVLQLGRQIIGHLLLKDPRTLQIDTLLSGMQKITGDDEPHLKAGEMYPEYLKKHFLNYYRIARGEAPFDKEYKEDIQDKQRQLKEMLALLHGGWDAQSQALITYLRGVQALPLLFPSVHTFIKTFEKPEDWQSCWSGLWSRMLIWQSYSCGMPLAESVANQMGISRQVFNAASNFLTVLQEIPFPGMIDTALTFGSQAFNYAKEQLFKTKPVQETIVSQMPSYAEILQEDSQVDQELEKAFNLMYEVKEAPPLWQKRVLRKFKGKGVTTPILKERYRRVNQSRKDYYAKANRVPNLLDFKGEAGVWEAYASLETFCESYKRSLNAVKGDLLKHVNLNIREGTPFTIEQLEWAVLKNDFSTLIEVCKLQQDEAALLTRVLTMCMVKETRLLQMQRVLKNLEKLNSLNLKEPKDKELYKEKLEDVADELQARRTYINTEKPIPDRLLFIYLLIEKKTDKLIWQRQADFIARFIPKDMMSAVAELLMSLGKTSTIIPALSKFEADGNKPVFVIYPKTIAPTNIKSSSDQAKLIFDQIIHGLVFNRAITLSEEEIQALSVIFRSTLSGEACAMTKEDAQTLELILFDRIFRYEKLPKMQRGGEERAIGALCLAIQIMRSGLAFQDEAHILFATDKEHNFPIGPKSRIKDSYYNVVERAMHILFKNPTFRTRLQENNLLRISPETLKDVIAPEIAEKMINHAPFNLWFRTKAEKQEFVDFVTGKLTYTPKWLSSDEKAFPQVLMLRGLLTVLLKNAFQRVVNVNFGASKDKKNGEFPRPADGNQNVDEEACIRAPYEALVKAFLMLGCKGLDQTQCLKLIHLLRKRIYDISKKHHKDVKDIPLYTQFCNSVPNVDIFKTTDFSQDDLDAIVAHFGKNTDAIELYMRTYLYKTIPYWQENLCSNSINAGSMFKFVRADTGTPYNDGAYPAGSKMIWDPGTTGEALHILKQRCNGINVLKKDAPHEVLTEVLENYFTKGKDFTAIIDGGALFKGLSNLEVAQAMLAHAKVHMPHIEAIVFFTKDADGNDQLVCLKEGKTPVPFDSSLSPEKYLSYFAQPNGFATDIKQKGSGIGLVLVGEQGPDQTLQVFMQNGFRMRELKVQKRVRIENEPPTKPQRIHFAMTQAAKSKISQNEVPTIDEIFDYGIRNEAELAKLNNYESQLQKIPNVLRSALIDKIVNARSVRKAIRIALDFRHVFISIIEDDPVKLFSFFENSVPYKEGLEAAVAAVEKLYANSPHFSKKEKNDLKEKLEALANPPPETMPEMVTVYKRDGETRVDLYSDLDKQTQIREQSGELDNEAEEEVENEQEQNQQNKQQHRRNAYSEKAWPIDFDIESNSWLRMTFIEDFYKESILTKVNRFLATLTDLDQLPFPIFYLYDLLGNAAQESLRKVSDAFDKRLWCSNNFIPKLVSVFQDPVDPGSEHQRALFQVLIHYDKDFQITHMAPLTIQEADYWRKALESSGKKPNVMVYDMELRMKVRGKEVPRIPADLPKLEVMLHFLDGRVNYPKGLIPHLQEWLSKQNVPLMKNAFQAIHADRGKEPFEGSDIALLFEELMQGH